jgi:hypothetical protein
MNKTTRSVSPPAIFFSRMLKKKAVNFGQSSILTSADISYNITYTIKKFTLGIDK